MGLTLKKKPFPSQEDSSGAGWETFEEQREAGRPKRRLGKGPDGEKGTGQRILAEWMAQEASPPPARTVFSLFESITHATLAEVCLP